MDYGMSTNQSYRAPESWVSRHWLDLFLVSILLYVVFNKNITIQFNLNTRGAQTAMVVPQAQVLPSAYQPEGKKLEVKPRRTQSAESKKFRNLTFVLSPDYAKRKKVPHSIVKEKIAYCLGYVDQFADLARKEMKEYGVPASITLAQGLLESDAGDSRLARESNNHFGIKCRTKCRSCTCRNYTDDDIYDMFRVFESPGESYREHSILLNSKRYQHLLKLRKSDYKGWARGLKKAGYATDRHYAEKLIQIIEVLNLDRFDR